MAKINFRVLLRPLCECQGYTEMSATELRVLISLIENGGCVDSIAELAKMASLGVRPSSFITPHYD